MKFVLSITLIILVLNGIFSNKYKSHFKSHAKFEEKLMNATTLKDISKVITNINKDIKNENKELKKEKKIINHDLLKVEDKVTNFLEKTENSEEIKRINNNILLGMKSADKKITKKENHIESIYNSVEGKLDNLSEKIENFKRNFEIAREKNEVLDDKSLDLELQNFKVKDKLDSHSDDFSSIGHTVDSKAVDLGSIIINEKEVELNNENVKFILGNDILSLKKFVRNIKELEELKKKCGENFSECKLITQDYINEKEKRQNEILKEIEEFKLKMKEEIEIQKSR